MRRLRRVLSLDELARLLTAARDGRPFRGLSGEDRRIVHIVASYSGLRAAEISSLSAESFDLGSSPPTLTVLAGYPKHRREDVLPIHPYLLAELRGWLPQVKMRPRVFPGTWADRSGDMIPRDLAAAEIEYETHDGVADFHALRHGYLTRLARSGVHPKTMQDLARHSTVTLTLDRYSHLSLVDLSAGLDALDAPAAKRDDADAVRATGTDGEAPDFLTGQLTGAVDFSCPSLSSGVRETMSGDDEGEARNSLAGHELSPPDTRSPRDRMVSPAGLEPATCGLGNRRSIRMSYGDTTAFVSIAQGRAARNGTGACSR